MQEVKYKFIALPQVNPDQIVNINQWPDLKKTINEITGQENSWSSIENRLENLRQTHGEPMSSYAQKTSMLYADYLSRYGAIPPVEAKEKVGRDVARQFIKGMTNSRVRNALISHGIVVYAAQIPPLNCFCISIQNTLQKMYLLFLHVNVKHF